MLEIRHCAPPESVDSATAAELRSRYLLDELFVTGEVRGAYTYEDRMVVAGAVPGEQTLEIPAWDVIGAAFHLERRELGIINLGESGEVLVDGQPHQLHALDGIYVGRGSEVQLRGPGARFYLISAIADVTHPLAVFSRDTVEPLVLGDAANASARTLYRYVWGGGHPSCQLEFGVTVIAPGSVWNTLPPHLHCRRTEVYLYTGLAPSERVVHLMGAPGTTRHLLVADAQAVISPPWSVHLGAGTAPYAFVWAMAGENTDYSDIDPVPVDQL
jgi:4-deoxy-L-threo-5-hexosulose-uronate ketol-isomerase